MAAENRTQQVSLGCGALILIALIVMIFGHRGIDELEGQIDGLRLEIVELKTSVEARSNTVRALQAMIETRNRPVDGPKEKSLRLVGRMWQAMGSFVKKLGSFVKILGSFVKKLGSFVEILGSFAASRIDHDQRKPFRSFDLPHTFPIPEWVRSANSTLCPEIRSSWTRLTSRGGSRPILMKDRSKRLRRSRNGNGS